jgi:hypothetical protein
MAKKPRKRFDTLGNLDMIKNSVTAIKHHADELTMELKKNPDIEAWVLTKVDRAAQNLSDVTHYLDGEMNKFADGGKMTDGGIRLRHKYSFVHEKMLYTFTVELNNSEDELFEFETMEQAFRFAREEELDGNRITDVSKYKKVGFQRYEREQDLLDKYKEWTPSRVDEIKINQGLLLKKMQRGER